MSKTKRPARTSAEIHRMVADQVIKAMETSGTNWVKSWTTPSGQLPTSMSTGKQYNGINLLILGMERAANGYGSHHWGTYNQWFKMGGGEHDPVNKRLVKTPSQFNVRRGEKSTTVIFYKPMRIQDKATGEDKTIPLLKSFAIFNADQVDGYTAPTVIDVDHAKLEQPNTRADKLAGDVGCDLRFSDPDRAFYSPLHDFINMPRATQFDDVENYAATLLHELTHWTGHASRLDRNLTQANGTKDYAKEELVAELGAAMLCGSLGITPAPRDDHAKYLANWMKRLKDDPKCIFQAAAKASAAADWLLTNADNCERLAA